MSNLFSIATSPPRHAEFIMEEIKENLDHDWFDELSEEQQASVLRGLEQLDNGQGITHEEAIIRLGL